MVSTAWFYRTTSAATTTINESKSKSRSENRDDSFPLVLVTAIGASVFLAGSATVLYLYLNHDRKTNLSGDDKRPWSESKKEERNIDKNDNVGDWRRPDVPKNKSIDKEEEDEDIAFDLPPHIQREIHKEERRKASIRFLAMKKPLYENIEMYAPDGKTMLCTIGTKKANWYVRKELTVWQEIPDANKSIRLLFEPKNSKNCKINQEKMRNKVANIGGGGGGRIETDDNDEKLRQYNCTHKLNICVSCGAKDASEVNNNDNGCNELAQSDESNTAGLMRHYVVPYAYRKLLPTKFKTHLPHDIVLLCLDCHVEAEQAAKIHRTDVYERLYRKDPSTRLAVVVDQDLKRVKSYARALWKHRDRLPAQRIEQYESAIAEHLTKTDSKDACGEKTISDDVLRELANLEPERKNPKYIPLADLVVQHLCQSDETILKFVVGWRNFFVETLRPRHLPAGWSVHSPVAVDVDP